MPGSPIPGPSPGPFWLPAGVSCRFQWLLSLPTLRSDLLSLLSLPARPAPTPAVAPSPH